MRILLICAAALALTACQKQEQPDPTQSIAQTLTKKYGLDRVIVGDGAADVCAFPGYVTMNGYRVTVMKGGKVYSGTACEHPYYENTWTLHLDAGSVFLNGGYPAE